jgi:hypothetical protein
VPIMLTLLRRTLPCAGTAAAAALVGCAVIGCANDPMYLEAPMTMDGGMPDPANMNRPAQARASLQLPIKTETADDLAKRMALADQLGVMVPYVRVGDLELDVEWTIKNLDPTNPGQALIELNGATEYFAFDPTMVVLDPGNDEAPPTPGLAGDIPIAVPAGGAVSGLFTEDQLREASIDLDQITRGNINPFRASLTVSKNAQSFQPLTAPMPPTKPGQEPPDQDPMGPPIPRSAFAEMVRIDLVFKPDRHMTLDFNVRDRDLRGIMHPLLLDAVTQKPGELQTFAPMDYVPIPLTTTP